MDSRERVLAALDRRPVDRIPTDYWGVPEITDALLAHFGVDSTLDLWPRLGVDKIISVAPTYVGPPLVDEASRQVDYWGVERTRQAEFEGRIAFHGGVDNQRVLPFGTPQEVEAEVVQLLTTLASDGTGYILAPCHNVQAITPVENVIRMYDAARLYGRVG